MDCSTHLEWSCDECNNRYRLFGDMRAAVAALTLHVQSRADLGESSIAIVAEKQLQEVLLGLKLQPEVLHKKSNKRATMQAHQRRLGATQRRGDHSHRRRTRACRSLLGYGAETGPSRGPQPPNKVRSSHPTLRMRALPQCAWATVLSAHTRSSLVPIAEAHPICTHTHTVGRALRQIACGLGNTKSGIAIVRHDLWFVILPSVVALVAQAAVQPLAAILAAPPSRVDRASPTRRLAAWRVPLAHGRRAPLAVHDVPSAHRHARASPERACH